MEADQEVKFLGLPDGRRMSYREMGVSKETATRSLLVLHGLASSRLAAMPGVSEGLLREMEVRLIAIDRPGYGFSDGNPAQTWKTAAYDIAKIADILELGDKFYLLGYSCGGAFCWAAARYIPERIAGIAMWAPVGSYWWKGIADSQRTAMFNAITPRTRKFFEVVQRVPFWMVHLFVKIFILRDIRTAKWAQNVKKTASPADRIHLSLSCISDLMTRDTQESLKQSGFGLAQDLHLVTSDWGFEPADVTCVYHGPFHIWHGDEDNLVPITLQRMIKNLVPQLVVLHELPGEGHLSPFCFNEKGHRDTLTALFWETEASSKLLSDDSSTEEEGRSSPEKAAEEAD